MPSLPENSPADKRLPGTVVVLSWVSFLNDAASDMVIPLMPLLFAGSYGGGAMALGLVEGLAETVASFTKLWAGRHSDVIGGKRKWLTFLGYALSNTARPMLGLIHNWVPALFLRSIDRVGKGVRTAPRDALVADVTPHHLRARAFGFHRALDNAGAVLGSLMAAAILVESRFSISDMILASAIPGTLALLLFATMVRDPARVASSRERRVPASLKWGHLSPRIRRYLWIIFLFTFARASDTFIVMRGHELGMTTPVLLVLWAGINLAKSVASQWGGQLADRFSHFFIIRLSWGLFALWYLCLALAATPVVLCMIALLYGLSSGMSEGIERAIVSDFAPAQEQGTAFGWYNMMLGLASVPAGLLFGAIWTYVSAGAAFAMGGVIAALATLLVHTNFLKSEWR
jgi:MFS-type transporter involved in bile tolerance (Atg22 family)